MFWRLNVPISHGRPLRYCDIAGDIALAIGRHPLYRPAISLRYARPPITEDDICYIVSGVTVTSTATAPGPAL